MSPDYYAILGVPADATEDEIRAAYRRLVRDHHPDLHPDRPDAHERMQELNAAYEVLSDPQRRAEYERSRGVPIPVRRGPAPPSPWVVRSHVDLSRGAATTPWPEEDPLLVWEALMWRRAQRLLRALLDW
jgi:curved DNA-binding protein CbpA